MGCPRPNTPRSNPYDLGELEKPLRDRLWTAFRSSPRRVAGNGWGLALVSGFRDSGRQWDLRSPSRGIPSGQQCNPRYPGTPRTAVPFSSQHQKRKAADIGGVDLRWLAANCARFGLKRTVSSELWHYEAVGTPRVPIIAYPGATYDNAGPFAQPVLNKEFTMDAEAKAAFKALNVKIDRIEKSQSTLYGRTMGWLRTVAEIVGGANGVSAPELAKRADKSNPVGG